MYVCIYIYIYQLLKKSKQEAVWCRDDTPMKERGTKISMCEEAEKDSCCSLKSKVVSGQEPGEDSCI